MLRQHWVWTEILETKDALLLTWKPFVQMHFRHAANLPGAPDMKKKVEVALITRTGPSSHSHMLHVFWHVMDNVASLYLSRLAPGHD